MSTRISLLIAVSAALLWLPACGGASDVSDTVPLPSGDCLDADGDGFGPGCDAGSDCDDDDADRAESCDSEPCEGAGCPGACEEGATKDCRVDLTKNGIVESCFVGVRVCVLGAWSACGSEV